MRFGTALWAPDLGQDPTAIREYTQELESAGFDYLISMGHLLSAAPDRFPDRGPDPALWSGPFYEHFALFAYLAAVTQRIEFRTAILILPLFETAAVAKQAAQLSLLSGGRFQLGVAISWNALEYQATGQDFHTRGRRMEEQIRVLRRLWSEPYVTFQGRWHNLDGIGLGDLPAQPIPIWIGCGAQDKLLRRLAKHADGWLCNVDPHEPMARLRTYLAEEGRDPATFGLQGQIVVGPDGPGAWVAAAQHLRDAGTTDLVLAVPQDLSRTDTLHHLVQARALLAEAL